MSAADCFWNWARGLAPVEHSGPPRKDILWVVNVVVAVAGCGGSMGMDMAGGMSFGGVVLELLVVAARSVRMRCQM